MNPALATEVAQTLHLAVNAIATVMLVPLGVATVYTVVKTIGIVIQNQKGRTVSLVGEVNLFIRENHMCVHFPQLVA